MMTWGYSYMHVLTIDSGDLRLRSNDGSVGGKSGRLEVQNYQGIWSTICDDGFDLAAANVACSQLEYERASDILYDQL